MKKYLVISMLLVVSTAYSGSKDWERTGKILAVNEILRHTTGKDIIGSVVGGVKNVFRGNKRRSPSANIGRTWVEAHYETSQTKQWMANVVWVEYSVKAYSDNNTRIEAHRKWIKEDQGHYTVIENKKWVKGYWR